MFRVKTAAKIGASSIAVYHVQWFKNNLEKTYSLKNIVGIDDMPEAELRSKIEYLNELSETHNIEIVVASDHSCRYDHFRDQIVAGSILKENPGCIEFTVHHELGHRRHWKYRTVPQFTILGAMAYLPFQSLNIRIFGAFIALSTVLHFLRHFDEFKSDEYACERTSLQGLQEMRSLFLREIDEHDNSSLWHRWTDVHPHPARRAAMINQYIKNYHNNNTVDAINPR